MEQEIYTRELLKERRTSFGISQNKLAVAYNLSREYINKIESRLLTPSDTILEKIFKQLATFDPELSYNGCEDISIK